ncbi:hypothetical protein C5B42_05270 [Candidatus Cerribacteria bacterium 'Amazon FNV 2010 28 9']|uniref:N-acetyltransferase domain-containing protein n=1 Tax=Candidatus Cerribacteria bacterium 'Amazon FNV 2010 28 9' TaxID=2081795 RepID=A0A317JM65_9BACT|nr:MAG: hypothetical protein C5B42_05270 [Candidatus Cerribacteria bacterium 'Amazon FNV 2010 28 9']
MTYELYNTLMSHFIPGKIIKEFTTKSGKHAIIRYPKWEDLDAMLEHINTVSKENTFITFSGEQETLESESKYLASEFESIEEGNACKLFCFVEEKFAGVCDVHRVLMNKKRSLHVGTLGLVISKEFRGDGIGAILMQTTIDEAIQQIKGLRLIQLSCFAANTPALNLYRKLGFAEVGRIPQKLLHKGEYIDEVWMTKTVASG